MAENITMSTINTSPELEEDVRLAETKDGDPEILLRISAESARIRAKIKVPLNVAVPFLRETREE